MHVSVAKNNSDLVTRLRRWRNIASATYEGKQVTRFYVALTNALFLALQHLKEGKACRKLLNVWVAEV